MTPARLILVLRAAFACAVMASTALMIDYWNAGDPAFCGVQSACLQVRRSEVGMGIAQWLGPITLPQLGVLSFVTLLAFSLFIGSQIRIQVLAAVTTVGGLAAGALIAAQASIHTFCLYCMIVDTSTVVAAATGLWLLRKSVGEKDLPARLQPALNGQSIIRWLLVGAFAVGGPFIWARFPVTPPLPAPIQAFQTPGRLTVVSFTDFQCPYCRMTHPLLTELRKRPDVDFHRVMAPLEMHPGAEPAALAYLCTPEDKRDALADLLYAADETHLTPPGVVEMTRLLGVDGDAVETCMTTPETKAKLAADKKLFQDAGGAGLPTTYVGRSVIVGFDADRYQRIIARADPSPAEIPVWLLFVLTGVTIAWASIPTLRAESATEASASRPLPKDAASKDLASEDEAASDDSSDGSSREKPETTDEPEA